MDCQKEVELLREIIAGKDQLIAEKERTIVTLERVINQMQK